MKVVYFGDSNSIFITNLLRQMEACGIDCELIDLFRELESVPHKLEKIKYIRKLETLYILHKVIKKHKFDPKDDIAHINFISFPIYLICHSYFKKNFKKYLLFFWGSDLYRQSKRNLKLMTPLYIDASHICFITPKMADDFHKVIPQFREKDYFLDFGLPILDEIDRLKLSEIQSFKKKINIPSDKTIIVIGYNRAKEQQHINVIRNLSPEVVDKSFFIFPWTYGNCDKEYDDKLNEVIKEKALNHIFIKKFLTDTEMAALRSITDILVQVQITDALSSSMMETLYAGKTVVTGKWLPYDILYENKVTMVTVDTPDEGGSVLDSVLERQLTDSEIRINKETVAKLCKWNSCIEKWKELYK